MNESETRRFAALIRDRLTQVSAENALGQDAQAVVSLDQQSVGRLSRMDALQSQAMAKATQQRRDIESTRLAAALVRLEDGSFGECEDCGDPIAPRRLELDLAATRCISCASG